MRLVVMGAPGAGKGTQCERLCRRFGVPQISTGDILREAKRNKTTLGVKAEEFMSKGLLVPDDVVIGIVEERLLSRDCANGFLLDGFPRTLDQAEALDRMLKQHSTRLDLVVSLDVAEDEVVKRISGRRTCSGCGEIHHVSFGPAVGTGRCDKCGGALVLRDDDREATVRERLRVYRDKTAPLLAFYEAKGQLVRVDGVGPVDEVSTRVLAAVERAARS
ncbi:MAG: adenylate kinase [Deltaproteobacteria bacterium]|nr:adenylate kinase [Deltaproteobacteria bacterium]